MLFEISFPRTAFVNIYITCPPIELVKRKNMKKILVKKNIKMKRNITGILVLCMVISSFNVMIGVSAINDPQIEQNLSYIDNLKVVKIIISQPSTLGELIDHDIDIIEMEHSKNYAVVLASSVELEWFDAMDFPYEILYGSIAEMNGWDTNPAVLRDFTNYAALTTQLEDIEDTYPDIAKLYDLGQSVQGRTIWGLKITDNPTIEEDEPEVRICGCHHGDELMSVELPLLLAWYLVDNYGSDPYIEGLVDNRETWIIPMVNPDGREATTRYNANGIDLNRDYGYMWGVYSDCYTQPETRAIRTHALDNNFVLSLSFHTSGDIVNYIWNYKGQPVADNAVVVFLSQQYGSHNGYWVVEGFDWYQTKGDTNDFSYGCRGDIDWTIEVQNYNIPDAWNLNRDAMIEIIDAADMGLRGIVTDATSGAPLSATVWVEEVYWPCFTDPKIGDYHRVLMPGTYTVHYQANGYQEEVYTVDVYDDEPTVLDVSLERGSDCYAYQVTSCNFYDPYGYPNNYQNNPTEAISALGPPDDSCASLGKGGVIVVDMEYDVTDQEGVNDLKIYEGDGSDDGYHVWVSQQFNGPWISIGSGFGTTEFDLSDGPIDWIRYVEIRDDYDGNAYEQNPGVDIDAVENLGGINMPPDTPEQPNGPTSGSTMVDYTFSTMTSDPEDEDIYYMWDWGDGNFSEWLGPYTSGETIETENSWGCEGTYMVRVKAKDINDAESGYSDPLIIHIGEGPILEIGDINGGLFKISMNIKNTGPVDAVGVDWGISLDGGFIPLGQKTTGIVVGIPAGGEVTVFSDMILGLGRPKVTGAAEIPDVSGDSKDVDAVVLLFLINIQ